MADAGLMRTRRRQHGYKSTRTTQADKTIRRQLFALAKAKGIRKGTFWKAQDQAFAIRILEMDENNDGAFDDDEVKSITEIVDANINFWVNIGVTAALLLSVVVPGLQTRPEVFDGDGSVDEEDAGKLIQGYGVLMAMSTAANTMAILTSLTLSNMLAGETTNAMDQAYFILRFETLAPLYCLTIGIVTLVLALASQSFLCYGRSIGWSVTGCFGVCLVGYLIWWRWYLTSNLYAFINQSGNHFSKVVHKFDEKQSLENYLSTSQG